MKTIKTHTRGFYNCEVWCSNDKLPFLWKDYITSHYPFHYLTSRNDNTRLPVLHVIYDCGLWIQADSPVYVDMRMIKGLFSFWFKNVLQRAIKGGKV